MSGICYKSNHPNLLSSASSIPSLPSLWTCQNLTGRRVTGDPIARVLPIPIACTSPLKQRQTFARRSTARDRRHPNDSSYKFVEYKGGKKKRPPEDSSYKYSLSSLFQTVKHIALEERRKRGEKKKSKEKTKASMDRSHNISNRLKHRMAQMLLTSSCTTTTTIMNISEKISQEPGFPFSDLPVHCRGKLDQRPHRVAPVVQVPIDCSGRRSIHDASSPNLPLTPEEENRYQKKERRVTESGVVYETGAGEGRKCPPASPSLPSNDYYYSHSKQRKKAMAEKKKPLSTGFGFSGPSSSGSNDEFGFFSSEEGEEGEEEEKEETWTPFSSKSFSSDSSEFYHRPSSKKTTKHKKSTRRPPMRRGARYFEDGWDEAGKFQPLIPISSKKKPPKAAEARTGFAVVKQSTNPYEDFQSSMVEMITEREMKEPEDLERLLHSYLSLNSACHHPAILEAFADLWEAIFGQL